MPVGLKAQIDKQKTLVAEQESNGNFETYDHVKLARLEKEAAKYSEVKDGT